MLGYWQWGGFAALLALALWVDLFALGRSGHQPSYKAACGSTIAWCTLSFMIASALWYCGQQQDALNFITAYVIELSLSVDNIFVFLLIFKYFAVDTADQHRILFWGVLGAVVMRLLMICGGIYLLHSFEFLIYLFGLFLVYSAYKLLVTDPNQQNSVQNSYIVTWLKKYLPFTESYHGQRFMVKQGNKTMFTPLALVLLMVEQTDLIFALDSIPAVLSITQDPFVVFSSNIMAVLGLRSLYFVISKTLDKFHYLHHALSIILGFVGIKMLITAVNVHIPTSYSLAVIFITLAGAITLSLAKQK